MKSLTAILTALTLSTSLALAADEKPAAAPESPKEPTPAAPSETKPRDLAAIFKILDANGDGNLTMEEFKNSAAAKKAPEKVEAIFKKQDADGNGSITLEEFKAAKAKKAK